MAMFNLKDSEDIKINRSSTTSDVLIEGEGLKRVEADDCHAGVSSKEAAKETGSVWSKVRLWILENLIKSVFAVLVAVAIWYWT